MTSVPGFLTKTFEIFSTPEYADCCGWGINGDTIIIRKIEQFSKQILPKYFKHSNFQSFVRQLNMYDFHKTVQDPNHGEFQHQYFKQHQPELLIHIKRKANNRGTETLKKFSNKVHTLVPTTTAAGSSSVTTPTSRHSAHLTVPTTSDYSSKQSNNHHISLATQQYVDDGMSNVLDPSEAIKLLPDELLHETDTVLYELEQQKALYFEFEKKMENKIQKIELENVILKKLFTESHQKNLVMQERMERVLKTLYHVFVGNGGQSALGNGTNPHQYQRLLSHSRLSNLLLTDGGTPGFNAGKKAITNTASSFGEQGGDLCGVEELPDAADGLLFDLNGIERFTSIDDSALNPLPGHSQFPATSSTTAERATTNTEFLSAYNRHNLAGKELSSVRNVGPSGESMLLSGITSFDMAAASVIPPVAGESTTNEAIPVPFLASFDGGLLTAAGAGVAHHSMGSTNSNEQESGKTVPIPMRETSTFYTSNNNVNHTNSADQQGKLVAEKEERVEVLPDVNDRHLLNGKKDDFTTSTKSISSGGGESIKRKLSIDPYLSSSGDAFMNTAAAQFTEKKVRYDETSSSSANEKSDDLNNLGNNNPVTVEDDDSSTSSLGMNRTSHFLDYMHRNQNTTLQRLDSLEQTIATLLEGMDYDEEYPNSGPTTFSSAADTTSSISPSAANLGSALYGTTAE